MSGAHIELDSTLIQQHLAELNRKLGNLSLPMLSYGEYLNRKTQSHFVANEDPFGNPWERLSENYEKPYNQEKILTLDGHLSGEMTINPHADGLEFGSNMEYAAVHQYGFDGGGIPARPFLGFNEADKQELVDTVVDFLRG